MMNFEDPIQFNLNKKSGNVEVSYSNLMEISQGGPEIGDLSVNGKLIEGYRFGGPCIIDNGFVFAPVYIKKFFVTVFKLSKIDVRSLEITILGKSNDLIYLDKVKGEKIYFFEDVNKTILRYFRID